MIANLIDIWYRITLSDFIWRDINWTLMEVLEFILMSVQINSVGLRSIQVKFHSIFFQKEIIQLRTQVMSTIYNDNFLISVFLNFYHRTKLYHRINKKQVTYYIKSKFCKYHIVAWSLSSSSASSFTYLELLSNWVPSQSMTSCKILIRWNAGLMSLM